MSSFHDFIAADPWHRFLLAEDGLLLQFSEALAERQADASLDQFAGAIASQSTSAPSKLAIKRLMRGGPASIKTIAGVAEALGYRWVVRLEVKP